LVTIDTDKRFAVLEKARFQTDNNELHAGGRVVADVVGNPSHVGVVQGSINFVKDEERRRLVGMDGEQQCQGCHCLLTA
jgi:hypothetical protein